MRKGSGGGPSVVIDAHLDTVFQEGLKIKVEMRDGKIFAPGVGDDTRNVVAMLAMIRALDAGAVRTKGDLVFLFTVEEETTFRGVEEFVKENRGASTTTSRSTRYVGLLTRHRHQLDSPLRRPGATRARATRPIRRAPRGPASRALPLHSRLRPPNLNIG